MRVRRKQREESRCKREKDREMMMMMRDSVPSHKEDEGLTDRKQQEHIVVL